MSCWTASPKFGRPTQNGGLLTAARFGGADVPQSELDVIARNDLTGECWMAMAATEKGDYSWSKDF